MYTVELIPPDQRIFAGIAETARLVPPESFLLAVSHTIANPRRVFTALCAGEPFISYDPDDPRLTPEVEGALTTLNENIRIPARVLPATKGGFLMRLAAAPRIGDTQARLDENKRYRDSRSAYWHTPNDRDIFRTHAGITLGCLALLERDVSIKTPPPAITHTRRLAYMYDTP